MDTVSLGLEALVTIAARDVSLGAAVVIIAILSYRAVTNQSMEPKVKMLAMQLFGAMCLMLFVTRLLMFFFGDK